MRNWMSFVPAVLLSLLFQPALLRAADPELTIKKSDFDSLVRKVDQLQSDITANSLRGNRTEEELRAIRVELQKIRELLEIMARSQGTIQRQSLYGPTPPPAAIPTNGTITLQNTYLAPATVLINGQAYPVEPYQTRTVLLPAGSFQYSVDVAGFGVVEPGRTDSLRPGGSYRINIFPR